MAKTKFGSPDVEYVFESYPEPVRTKLLALRDMIIDVANVTPGVGYVEEALRWKQPSYLTSQSGSGSTIRLDACRCNAEGYDIFFHCQSGLVEHFRDLYGDGLTFVGKRSIHFDIKDKLRMKELHHCISLALTHHLRKKLQNKSIGQP